MGLIMVVASWRRFAGKEDESDDVKKKNKMKE